MPLTAIKFSPPRHGWIETVIQIDEVTLRADVSDVPSDSLAALVDGLIAIQEGTEEAVIEWHLEPEWWSWHLRAERQELRFRASSPCLPSVEAVAQRDDLLRRFTRALLRLRTDPVWEQDAVEARAWSWPFPHARLERLRALTLHR